MCCATASAVYVYISARKCLLLLIIISKAFVGSVVDQTKKRTSPAESQTSSTENLSPSTDHTVIMLSWKFCVKQDCRDRVSPILYLYIDYKKKHDPLKSVQIAFSNNRIIGTKDETVFRNDSIM